MKTSHLIASLLLAAVVAQAQDDDDYSDFDCPEPDGIFGDDNVCDKYYRCTDGVAKEETCPDGLLFIKNRGYPCGYPQEVECASARYSAISQPTDECPRQFAIFRASEDPSACGSFVNCVNGKAFLTQCPNSLAFNEDKMICEYADEVESCDASAFLDFQCPNQEFSPDQVGEYTKEAHPTDCSKFFLCLNKEDGSVQPRLHGCEEPSVFDPATGECSFEPENVPGCENAIPEEVLKAYRSRAQAESDRREARLQELRDNFTG